MGPPGELGRKARRRHACRAPSDAADGALFADPLSQIVIVGADTRGLDPRHRFPAACATRHAKHHSGHRFLMPPPACAIAPGPARPGDAAASRPRRHARNARPGCAPPADRPTDRARRHRPPASPANRSATSSPIRRRAVPARRRRPRNARPDAPMRRQHPGDPAARQPRRRPDRPARNSARFLATPRLRGEAEIRAKARISGEGDSPRVQCGKGANSAPKSPPTTAPLCLTARRPSLYAARSRDWPFQALATRGGVAQLVRARES